METGKELQTPGMGPEGKLSGRVETSEQSAEFRDKLYREVRKKLEISGASKRVEVALQQMKHYLLDGLLYQEVLDPTANCESSITTGASTNSSFAKPSC